jgi:hypothetical protein
MVINAIMFLLGFFVGIFCLYKLSKDCVKLPW